MNHTPRISIIIPVYKVENYLEKCLESVLLQTLSDLEIILVDDGSPDACPAICDSYARKDTRIQVIHQDNQGLAGARNTGLRRATGEYVAFLDADDYLEPDAYAKLYTKAIKYDADIVFCQAKYFDETTGDTVEALDSSSLPLFIEERFSGCFSWHDVGVKSIFSYNSFVVAWNKICKRSFLSDLQADFPAGLIYEDNPFYFQTFFAARKISVVRERLIIYRIHRKGSIIQNVNEGTDARAIHILAILAETERRLLALEVAEIIISTFYQYAFNEILYKYQLVPECFRQKYMVLAKGILPPLLYRKLLLCIGIKALKTTQLSSFLSIQREKGKRTVKLFGVFPLVTVCKFYNAPREYNCIVIMNKDNSQSRTSNVRQDNRVFHLHKINLLSIINNFLTAILDAPCSNRAQILQVGNNDMLTSCDTEINSIRGLLLIVEDILFVDTSSLDESEFAKVKTLYYVLNCIFPHKKINFILATPPTLHCRMKTVEGLEYKPSKDLCRYDIVELQNRLAKFGRHFEVRVLGFPIILIRKI